MITTEQVKALRDKTGVSVMQCRKALEEAGGDEAKAIELLRTASAATAEKKSDRALGAGAVSAYVHSTGTVGVLVELLCETDFVAKNEEFKTLGKELGMHIAAMSPESVEALLTQPFVKNPEVTVQNMIQSAVQKFGEHIELAKFVRYAI